MLKEQYARLYKGRPSSNDAKLLKESKLLNEDVDPGEYIDVDKMRKLNRYDLRDSHDMYDDGEKIIVPLKKPIGGKTEFEAEVYKDTGFTSFSFTDKDMDAFESVGIDTLNELDRFMEDNMF